MVKLSRIQLVADGHGGDEHVLAVAALAALELQLLAERQEFRIALNIGDELEHVVGRMGDTVFGLIDVHGAGAPSGQALRGERP